MGCRVAFSRSARRDLRDVSLDSPERALASGRLLVSSTRRRADFPEMGRVFPEFGDPSIREIVVRSYRVVYQVDTAACRIEVARFWHGALGAFSF